MVYTLTTISQALNGVLVGDGNTEILGVASVSSAKAGQIAYVTEKNVSKINVCEASALVVPVTIKQDFSIPVIKVKNPRLAFAYLISMFQDNKVISNGEVSSNMVDPSVVLGDWVQIDHGAVILENVRIGDNTAVGSNTYVGVNVTIGHNCLIHPNVTILRDTVIGNNVIIHSGAVIGADGFGFEWDGEKQVKIPHIGNVIISDDVEIGANTAIDRGTLDSTFIGRGTKIDNLVQIGHNVQIGEHCLIAATSAIAGSSVIGNRVVLAGGCGIVNSISIGDESFLFARTGVTKDLPEKSIVSGYWARPHKEQLKEYAVISKLPKTLKEMHKQLEAMKKMEE